ncbi:MAG: hypothetical protein ACI95C_000444 [Pseudohongiellaceae bacterium]|jgi:hypothetical protein
MFHSRMIHTATGCGKGSAVSIQDESVSSETGLTSKDWGRSALGLRLQRVLHLQPLSLHSDRRFQPHDFNHTAIAISESIR